ncbi:hypothetical protein [uncultured Maritimibacter sp.]|jgi:hypothetical protein|uniref:hypothetical protein n=1 Tax=uncultured Maritimibacter sp. TaxID=991866 RepID=UPI00262B7E7D|nr:hypothetical protein [uncultured Maritimibacter sp.]
MLFMVLVGGLGSFAGPIIGALALFALQEVFGDFGAWYLAGIGVVAILFALYAPQGVAGLIGTASGPIPCRCAKSSSQAASPAGRPGAPAKPHSRTRCSACPRTPAVRS